MGKVVSVDNLGFEISDFGFVNWILSDFIFNLGNSYYQLGVIFLSGSYGRYYDC